MKDRKELREKILKGIQLAIEKLISVGIKNDEELVIYKDGKIVKIKARDLKKAN